MGKRSASAEIKGIDYDAPLLPETAIDRDQLHRLGFAEIATSSLRKVPSTSGFVLSIEGPWGSGKSSVLAMIEALLNREDRKHQPVIVHFNPWLIGDKDALLRQFLASIATAVKLSDHSKDGRKVAKELKAYSKVFDVFKLIPGVEPWASLIKSVMDAAGDATEAIAEYKTPDLEKQKERVEAALRSFDCPVIVFIDDVDRLFPAEVFEMIRIIKAVGGLPRVGYVVAWDSTYVTAALSSVNVPQSSSYLDKIVQVRMPLPNLSLSARSKLFDSAVGSLDPKAIQTYFEGQTKRLGFLYQLGLRDLLEQPRDIARVFNAVRMIEPLLRGEIVFADILGLAALSVKAPQVYDLLRTKPQLFVGRLPSEIGPGDSTKLIANGSPERTIAYANGSADAIRKVVHFLFPEVAAAEEGFSMGDGKYTDGVISDPSRLVIALQLGITDGDVSIKTARQYLENSAQREVIIAALAPDVCHEFMEMLGQVGSSLPSDQLEDIPSICVSLAQLVDSSVFVKRGKHRDGAFGMSPDDLALRQIKVLTASYDSVKASVIYTKVAIDPYALSCAAELLRASYVPNQRKYDSDLLLEQCEKDVVIKTFAENVLKATEEKRLFEANLPSRILWTLARLSPQICRKIFRIIETTDESLDHFALHFLRNSWDSSNGQAYGLPSDEEVTKAFCPLKTLRQLASNRLADQALTYPARAAWQSVLDGKPLYGVDGTDASR